MTARDIRMTRRKDGVKGVSAMLLKVGKYSGTASKGPIERALAMRVRKCHLV
jgi:hypothetical protein